MGATFTDADFTETKPQFTDSDFAAPKAFSDADFQGAPKIQLDPYQQIVAAGKQGAMEVGNDDFLRGVANDPVGFIKSLPASGMAVASAPGRVAYLGAADVISKAFSQPEYGGNLAAADRGESVLPVDKFIGQAAATNPRLALAAKLAEGAPELASMMAVNPSGTAGKLIAAGFSADMIHQAKPLFDAYAEERAKPVEEQDPAKLNDLKSQVVQTFLMAPLAGAHAFGEGRDAQNARALAQALDATRPNMTPVRTAPITASAPASENPGMSPDALRGLQTAMRQNQIPTVKQSLTVAPQPEPAATVQAQVDATRDPLSPKAATLITPGEQAPPTGHGLTEVQTAQGTALVNPTKVDPIQAKAVLDAGGGGQLLGMSTDTKPDLTTGEPLVTVQTKTADGTPVQEELANAQTLPAAIAASKRLAPDGTVELKSPATVIAERQTALAAEPPPPMPVDVSDAEVRAMRPGNGATEAPPDILSTIADHYPNGVQFASKADYGEYLANARGAAKDLMSHTAGEPADKVIDALHLNGQFHDIETPDQLAQAMVDAGETRINGRGAGAEQARALAQMKKRDELFRSANQPDRPGVESLPIEQLFVGDQFKLNGQPMRVTGFATDEAGRPTGVELQGAYGSQTVPAGEKIHLDEGTLNAPGRVAASGSSAPRPVKAPGFAANDIGPLRRQAREYLSSLKGKSFLNEDTHVPISIDRHGVREPVSGQRKAEELHVLSALPELLRTAKHVETKPDEQGRPDIKAWHYYQAQAEWGGKTHDLTLVARELNDGRRFYDSYTEKPAAKSGAASSEKTLGGPQAAGPNQGNAQGGDVKGRVAAAGSSAPRPTRKQALQVPQAVAATPAPRVTAIGNWLHNASLGFKTIFAPHAIDAGAAQVANILRDVNGERAVKLAQADEAMHDWRQEFDRTPVRKDWRYSAGHTLPHNYAIIDALERDRASLPPRYQQLAAYFDQAFKDRIQVIQKFAPNALQHLIENYFPHIWEDPKRAAGVMAQVANRSFAGRKEFLKQRTLPMFMDGLARGLKPISDNPVDLLLAKMHSMDKFIAALKAQAEFKDIGKMKFKYALEAMPDGYTKVDDPAFVVNAPPTVTMKEAFDMQLRTRTLEFLQKLGVPQSRLATLGGKRWGLAYESPEQIKTRFAGPMSVYWHELGHVLDYRYNLQKSFLKQGKLFDAELRNLADRRVPQQGATKSFRQYVRRGEEKMAVMAEAYVHAPELFQRVAPTVYRAFDQFIENHPELHDIREIKPSLRMDTASIEHQLPGVLKLGDWIMPEGPAQVMKNYLSPGFNGGVFRSVRQASNLLNAAQLGLSAFHVGFTSLDAAISTAEVGLYRLAHGDVRGAKQLASAPLAPVLNYYSGKAIQRAMLDPQAKSIKALNFGVGKYRLPGIELPISQRAHDYAQLAVKGGLRATVDPFWQTHMTRNLVRSVREGGMAWAKTPLQAPLAAVEQMMRPIAEYLVPRQKLGVFAQLARSEMDRLPAGADIHAVRAAMARAADATEDRMGQMTYDNLFYNRMAKDLALLAFRAYGWQLGKYRHLAGAVADTAAGARALTQGKWPDLTHRQLYFVTLAATVGAVGGILHRLLTGQSPQTLTDYLHPSTGQKDALGNDKRLSLPSYLKDLESDAEAVTHGWKQGGPLGVGQGLWQATYHRLNPWVSEGVDLLNNRDFYGTQIWNPDDPLQAKMLAQAKFIGEAGVPFSIAGTLKMREGEHSLRDVALPFIGVVPAKRAISMTPAQLKAAEIAQASQSIGGRTQAQAAHSEILRNAVADLRGGKPATNLDKMSKADEATIRARLQMNPLQFQVSRMPMDSAMQVYDLANPAERQQLQPLLIQKLQSQAKRGEAINTNYVRILTGAYNNKQP